MNNLRECGQLIGLNIHPSVKWMAIPVIDVVYGVQINPLTAFHREIVS